MKEWVEPDLRFDAHPYLHEIHKQVPPELQLVIHAFLHFVTSSKAEQIDGKHAIA